MQKNRKTLLIVPAVVLLLAVGFLIFVIRPDSNKQPLSASGSCMGAQKEAYEVLLRCASNDKAGALDIIHGSRWAADASDGKATVLTDEILEEYLRANQITICGYEEAPGDGSSFVNSPDVQVNRVILCHDASNDTWVVTSGGFWVSTAWKEDFPWFSALTGAKNVGGMDSVGFSFLDTSGPAPALLSSSGYVHDGNGNGIALSNPANGDSFRGVLFEYSDQVYLSDTFAELSYLGYGFAAQGVYSGDFSEFHGRARSYYAHTGKDGVRDSIGFGPFGFSASWPSQASSWESRSEFDTVF